MEISRRYSGEDVGDGEQYRGNPGFSEEFLQHFGLRLGRLLAPQLPLATVQAAIMQTLVEARNAGAVPQLTGRPGPGSQAQGVDPPGVAGSAGRKMELVFVHDCRNHGCNVTHCVLCKHNPNKRCTGNFAHKYWVGDRLLAKCEGEIQVELNDAVTGERIQEDLTNFRIEACILDGNKYNTRCREAGEQRLDILDECEVLRNQKGEPLLVSASSNNTAEDPRVQLKFTAGTATVPLREVKVTESSESVLAGTKRPPFRLVVRAVRDNGRRLHVRPAVSEEFVVVTKRTKNLKKQEIPSLDDPIAKLNHIGKETVKKLNELKASADEVQLDIGIPPDLNRITKVKEFLRLARLSEADGHLQQKLKQLLKLSKEKWDAACEHAKTAVQVDNRMRAWYMQNMSVGLLYTCALGDVRPDCPVALIQNRKHEGADFMEVIPMEHQMPAQREQVQGTCEQAIRCWWEDAHPGWMIFTLGNKHFETLDQIIQFSRSDQQAEPNAHEAEVVDDAAEYRGGVSYPPTVPDASAGSASSGRSEMNHAGAGRGMQRPSSTTQSQVGATAAGRGMQRGGSNTERALSQVGSPTTNSPHRSRSASGAFHEPQPPHESASPAGAAPTNETFSWARALAPREAFSSANGLPPREALRAGALPPPDRFEARPMSGPPTDMPLLGNADGGGNFNPFEFMTGMPFNPNAPGQAPPDHDGGRRSPPKPPHEAAAAALVAAGWPQSFDPTANGPTGNSIPPGLLPLLSLNTLVKMGSLPSLGMTDNGSLLPGLSSLAFPDSTEALPPASAPGENGARHDVGGDDEAIPPSTKRKRGQPGEAPPGERGESPPARVNPARWEPGARDGGSDSRTQ